jgi:hypothetical protein
MAPRWSHRFPPTDSNFQPSLVSRSGGPSLAGYEQTVVFSAGRWTATMTFHISRLRGAPITSGGGILYWNWFLAYMQGRANTISMPTFADKLFSPGALAAIPAPALVPHGDGASFSDGALYRTPRSPAAVIGTYAGGETSMTLNMIAAQTPQPGQRFSVNDRLFVIRSAAPLGTPNYWQLGLWPSVREPILAGTFADFDDPHCLVRLAKDDTAALTLKPGFQGDVSIDFVEAPIGG